MPSSFNRVETLALLLALVLTACSPSEVDADLTTTAPGGPQVTQPELTDDLPFDRSYSMTESPDGKLRLFTGETRNGTNIFQMRLQEDGSWSAPELLDWPKVRSNTSPFFSPHDGRLYFASDRPVPNAPERSDMNIWSIGYEDGVWGDAMLLPGDVNTNSGETDVSIASDGTLYFVSKHPRGKGGQDIYTARYDAASNQWLQDSLPEAINSPLVESHALILPDGKTLIWYSRLRPNLGSVDLKAAILEDDGSWTGPISLGPRINTPGIDFGPGMSADGLTFFFSRDGQMMEWPMSALQAEISRARQALETDRVDTYLGLSVR